MFTIQRFGAAPLRLLFVALAVAASSCRSSPTAALAPGSVTLAPGESYTPAGSTSAFRFLRVVQESRCPVDVVCITAGNAMIEMSTVIPAPGFGGHWYLNTNTEPRTFTFGAYVLRLEDLLPKPRSTTPTDSSTYRAVISVTVAPATTGSMTSRATSPLRARGIGVREPTDLERLPAALTVEFDRQELRKIGNYRDGPAAAATPDS